MLPSDPRCKLCNAPFKGAGGVLARLHGPWLPVGAAVHTGEAYFGTVGTVGSLSDFTQLGEQVNLAARLGSAAGPGELLVTGATLEACRRPVHMSERRTLDLKGISQPVEVNVVVPGRGA